MHYLVTDELCNERTSARRHCNKCNKCIPLSSRNVYHCKVSIELSPTQTVLLNIRHIVFPLEIFLRMPLSITCMCLCVQLGGLCHSRGHESCGCYRAAKEALSKISQPASDQSRGQQVSRVLKRSMSCDQAVLPDASAVSLGSINNSTTLLSDMTSLDDMYKYAVVNKTQALSQAAVTSRVCNPQLQRLKQDALLLQSTKRCQSTVGSVASPAHAQTDSSATLLSGHDPMYSGQTEDARPGDSRPSSAGSSAVCLQVDHQRLYVISGGTDTDLDTTTDAVGNLLPD